MRNLLPVLLLACAACQPQTSGEAAGTKQYMQIFYIGPEWVPNQPVLLYSPSFRGRQAEVVADTDSTLEVAPTASLLPSAVDTTTVTTSSIHSEPDSNLPAFTADGHLNPRYEAAERRARRQSIALEQEDNAQQLRALNRKYRLRLLRVQLGQRALTKALNEAGADGWEVTQMLNYGDPSQGHLLYLLRHR